MIPRGWGLPLVLAVLLAWATGAVAQRYPTAPRPQGAPPGQPAAGIRPATPAQPQPGAAAQPQAAPGAQQNPLRLGRRFPSFTPLPPHRPEPRVSVSVVSPQGSSVYGRRTHGGSQPQGMTNDQRMMSGGMGGGQ